MKSAFAVLSTLALGALATVAPSAPAQAASCSVMTIGYSYTYDYAWITDKNQDCGYMSVGHYYNPGGQNLYTWDSGYGYYEDTNREAQLYSADWSW